MNTRRNTLRMNRTKREKPSGRRLSRATLHGASFPGANTNNNNNNTNNTSQGEPSVLTLSKSRGVPAQAAPSAASHTPRADLGATLPPPHTCLLLFTFSATRQWFPEHLLHTWRYFTGIQDHQFVSLKTVSSLQNSKIG